MPPDVVAAAKSGDSNAMADAIAARSVDNNGINAGRRAQEADMIRNDRTMPNGATAGNSVPPQLAQDGYTYGGTDAGGAFYTKTETLPDGTQREVSLQYEEGSWWKYDTATGNPIDKNGNIVDINSPEGQSLMENGYYTDANGQTINQDTASYDAPPAPGAGGIGGAGTAGAQAMNGGMQVGGAGCKGGGASPAGLGAAGGLMGQLGGIAQNAAMAGAMAALSGGGLQGVMGAMLGSAGGALGNALGAAAGGVGGAFVGQALGGALGGIVAGANPLQALSGAAFGALSSMGSSLIPGLSNVMPAALAQGAIAGLAGGLGALAGGAKGNAAFQYALAGGLGGTINSYIGNMTGNFALGSLAGTVATGALNGTLSGFTPNSQPSGQINLMAFARNIQAAAAVANNNRVMVGAITEAMGQTYGSQGVSGYGAKTRNSQDALTFSFTTLGQNLSAVAADFQSMGTWSATNLMRFMQPGHVAAQILNKGLGGYTGLQDALTASGVAIAGIDNPLFDRITQSVLLTIDDPEVINTVRTAFAMSTRINNLGELTKIEIMMPTSYKSMPVSNFRELGIQLAIIGIRGSDITCRKIGDAIAKLETGTDLNYISQLDKPLDPAIGNNLLSIYGYGGGSLGEQTMADFIGTAAGYVHTDTLPVILRCSEFILNSTAGATLKQLNQLLKDTVDGKFTDLGSPGDPGADPPIPDDPGGITVPFPSGSQSFGSLDEAVLAFIPLIEAEQQALLNSTDPEIRKNLAQLEVAYNASVAQLIKESNNLIMHDIDLFVESPPTPDDAMGFVDMLESYGLETGYGQAGDYIERIATNDFYGDCIKYVMRQSRNANVLEDLGIDVEQYKLPQSQYLRDPEGFYKDLYTGNMPAQSQNRKAHVFPRTPRDVYLLGRENVLAEIGYADADLLNDQKDELYYDAHWVDVNSDVLEDIGRNAVKTVIDRNMIVSGNDLLIVGLDGTTTKFGEIKENGLFMDDPEFLIATLLEIVNKVLYGNIRTTKFENPFKTDQMVYGIVELLAQVTNQNAEALLNTVTGGLIANGLLEQLISKFSETRNIYDTKMNRNDPGSFGGVGASTTS